MCGIFCEICCKLDIPALIETDVQLLNFLKCRGPNSNKLISRCIDTGCTSHKIWFFGSVLWMQGNTLTSQPVVNDLGVLLYNGDVLDDSWDKNISDTSQIMEMLSEETLESRKQRVFHVLSRLKGPYSIVYYDVKSNLLFFSRDEIGRNSLLFCQKDQSIIISSVLGREYEGTVEIPATHMYTLELERGTVSSYCRTSHQRTDTRAVHAWLQHLTTLQALPDDAPQGDHSPSVVLQPEDLKLISEIENIAVYTKCATETMKKILTFSIMSDTVDQLTKLLKTSVKLRIEAQPFKCKNCIESESQCRGHCTVAVLFSGGLDCSLVALLADRYLPPDQPIDLINVAFSKSDGQTSFDVPDRLTGRLALSELKSLRPKRQWQFVEVNVSEKELREEQESTIAELVHPRRTVLDESLGSALWFAARAGHHDRSTSRVLLTGSGADELFGGYTRHRTALRRGGWSALERELALDWRRISRRNLARDDRVIAHHARQPRLPYLDQDLVRHVLRLKPWLRCMPSAGLGPGLGDKLVLRLVAYRLGLVRVSVLPKRALQFGSRIANKKENGADISQRFIKLNVS